eukprot:364640-Chlamydomonas_euryale.AAC.20
MQKNVGGSPTSSPYTNTFMRTQRLSTFGNGLIHRQQLHNDVQHSTDCDGQAHTACNGRHRCECVYAHKATQAAIATMRCTTQVRGSGRKPGSSAFLQGSAIAIRRHARPATQRRGGILLASMH